MSEQIIPNTMDIGILRDHFLGEIVMTQPELDLLAKPPIFTPAELQSMHRYCLKYRQLVRSGGTPIQEQHERFMLFQAVCYAEGVACE